MDARNISFSSMILSNNSLTGHLVSEIGTLGNLTTLELDGNALTGSLPSELAMLTNLESLNLYNTNVTGTLPFSLCGLSVYGSTAFDCHNLKCVCAAKKCVEWCSDEHDVSYLNVAFGNNQSNVQRSNATGYPGTNYGVYGGVRPGGGGGDVRPGGGNIFRPWW